MLKPILPVYSKSDYEVMVRNPKKRELNRTFKEKLVFIQPLLWFDVFNFIVIVVRGGIDVKDLYR